jgi:hypothetical protein
LLPIHALLRPTGSRTRTRSRNHSAQATRVGKNPPAGIPIRVTALITTDKRTVESGCETARIVAEPISAKGQSRTRWCASPHSQDNLVVGIAISVIVEPGVCVDIEESDPS